MVTEGLADTDEPVVVFNPVEGAQVYVAAPLALIKIAGSPAHKTGEAGVTEITGLGFTVTVIGLFDAHPLRSVPVTVYVTVTEGEAVTLAPVEALRSEVGNHE